MLRSRLRSCFAALVATAAFTQVASAADLPAKAPMWDPASAWSWSGVYVGVNAGYGVGLNPTNEAGNGTGFGFGHLDLTQDTMAPQGFVGGGQIGYNWLMTPNWLLGVEVDFQGSTQKDSSCTLECGFFPLNSSQELPWFGTARARLGYVNGDYLWYVTGGGAWAKVNSDYSLSYLGATDSGSSTETKGGFVVGAGVETHLAGNWTAKLEYLYMDLGTVTNTYATPNLGGSVTVDSEIRDNIVRVGLNYKLTP